MKTLCLWSVVGLMLLAGCTTPIAHEPAQSGFLSRYDQLQKIDETSWRFVDATRLRNYRKFHIQPVQMLIKTFDGKPIAEGEKMAADYVVMALVKALSDRYPIVSDPGADVGELHLAITGADKKGTELGLKLEGEVLDSASGTQAAALMKSEVSRPHDWNWSYRLAYRQMVTEWAVNFRRLLDEVHSR